MARSAFDVDDVDVVDVVVRWHGDVVSVARLGARERRLRAGPFRLERTAANAVRIDGAHVAVPCVVTRGALDVTVRRDVPHEAARAVVDVDPVLLRAAGVPLVLMAGLFAALAVTDVGALDDDDAFAFDLVRGARAAQWHRASSSLSSSLAGGAPAALRFAASQPSTRTTRRHESPTDPAMFAPIEQPTDEDIAEFMGMIATIANDDDMHASLQRFADAAVVADDVLSSEDRAQLQVALASAGARSGGDIGVGIAGLGIGIGAEMRAALGVGRSISMRDEEPAVVEIVADGALGASEAIDLDALRFREPFPDQPEPKAIHRWAGPATFERVRPAPCASLGDIHRELRARAAALRACAERFPDAALGHRFEMRWRIDTAGRFVDVNVADVEPAKLGTCFVAALRGASVRQACEQEITVRYPLLFDGAG